MLIKIEKQQNHLLIISTVISFVLHKISYLTKLKLNQSQTKCVFFVVEFFTFFGGGQWRHFIKCEALKNSTNIVYTFYFLNT